MIYYFLCSNLIEINNHHIISELHYLSDHVPLTIDISITEDFIQEKHWTIIRNSEEKENFISDLTKTIENIDTLNILDKESLKLTVQEYIRISEFILYKHSHCINITKHFRV